MMRTHHYFSTKTSLTYMIMVHERTDHLCLQINGTGSITYIQPDVGVCQHVAYGDVDPLSEWIGKNLCSVLYGEVFDADDFRCVIDDLEDKFHNGYPYHSEFQHGSLKFHLYSSGDKKLRKVVVDLDVPVESTCNTETMTISRDLFSYDANLPQCVLAIMLLGNEEYDSPSLVEHIINQYM